MFYIRLKQDNYLNGIFYSFLEELYLLGYSKFTILSYWCRLKSFGTYFTQNNLEITDKNLTDYAIFRKTLIFFHKRLKYLNNLRSRSKKHKIVTSLNQYISAWNSFKKWYCRKFNVPQTAIFCPLFKVVNRLPNSTNSFNYKELVNYRPSDSDNFMELRRWCILDLFCTAALRVNELKKLRIENLYLDRRYIYLDRRFKYSRRIYLDKTSCYFLRRYLKLLNRHLRIKRLNKKFPLFSNRAGSSLSYVNIINLVKSITYEITKQEIKPHTLRVTCGFHYFMKTKGERLIQEFMGYSSVKTVLNFNKIDVESMKKVLEAHHPRYARVIADK